MDIEDIKPQKIYTIDNFKNVLINLLPVGLLWNVLNEAFKDFMESFAVELNRVDQRLIDLQTENFPKLSTSSELLPDWERVAYLADEYPPAGTSEAERQTLVHTKIYTVLPGPTEQFFIDYAADLNITITSFGSRPMFRVGTARVGDRLADSLTSAFEWIVNYTGGTTAERLAMKNYFNRLRPAHTRVTFNPAI